MSSLEQGGEARLRSQGTPSQIPGCLHSSAAISIKPDVPSAARGRGSKPLELHGGFCHRPLPCWLQPDLILTKRWGCCSAAAVHLPCRPHTYESVSFAAGVGRGIYPPDRRRGAEPLVQSSAALPISRGLNPELSWCPGCWRTHPACWGHEVGSRRFVWQVAVIYKERRSFFGNAL